MHTQISTESYGKWSSPLDAEHIAEKTLNFSDLYVDQGTIYWTENRPHDKNRNVIVSYDKNGSYHDETSTDFHVSSSVHGYGGGAFLAKGSSIYFSDAVSGLVYQKNKHSDVTLNITDDPNIQYADFDLDQTRGHLYALQKKDSKTSVARICLQTKHVDIVCEGSDFYSNFRVSPDGKKCAWLQWNHPNMPWDCNELWIADINSHHDLINKQNISGERKESFYQPEWSCDSELFVVSDRSGYWNIYKCKQHPSSQMHLSSPRKRGSTLIPICPTEADFGRPLWVAGTRCYSFLSRTKIIACCIENGIWKTALIDLEKGGVEFLENPLTCIYNIAASDKDSIALIGGNEKTPLSVVKAGIHKNAEINNPFKILRSSCQQLMPEDFISIPQAICFPTTDGDVAHAFYYAPKNPQFCAPKDTLPPLVVKVHGGPTANVDFMFNPKIQYYTSRGFAYVEVNYRGSTGYGRSYREKLKGMWGIYDVDDCISCAQYLCDLKLADPNHLFITGSSSGGYTVLCSLAFRPTFYKSASCLYGIGDLIALSEHTHKFEAFYDQGLIGADIHDPQGRKVYEQRSPIHSADQIKTPIIFFHGDKDPVVSVEQTLAMAAILEKNHIKHEVHIFEGEGHGFKKKENIVTLMERESGFWVSY